MQARVVSFAFGVVIALSLFGSAGVQARGARDGACAGERGAAFGLCVAYCVALDCDAEHRHAGARACGRLQAAYLRFTGLRPPCVRATCPCSSFDANSIAAATWAKDERNLCGTLMNPTTGGVAHQLELIDEGASDRTFFTAGELGGEPSCSAFGLSNGEPINEELVPISEEEVAECIRVLQDAAQTLVASGVLSADNNFCGTP